jgi:micrococcal nuclease
MPQQIPDPAESQGEAAGPEGIPWGVAFLWTGLVLVGVAPWAWRQFSLPDHPVNGCRGEVVYVIDGDTFAMKLPKTTKEYKIRVKGIDAPEAGQDYNEEAKLTLETIIHGEKIVLEQTEEDSYGRTMAQVLMGEGDVGLLMLEQGAAWVHGTSPENEVVYKEAQAAAKADQRGLWKNKSPTRPAEFRNEQRERKKLAPDEEEQ